MTVLETIQRSADFLAKKGVDTPRLQAELLLAHVLGLKRMQLYLNFERALTEEEIGSMREAVRRRSVREPLQQIVGSTSFCGYEIGVNRQVLIPRPETELLAERGWRFLNELSGAGRTDIGALDFGTGSGCIAIALAAKCPAARLVALDASAAALETAAQNAAWNGLEQRIQFCLSDGFRGLDPGSRFDLVVSNPPYIPTAEIVTLQPEVRLFDPLPALDGGEDGLNFYRSLAAEATGYLKPGGKIMLEFGDGQAEALRELFTKENWIVEAVEADYTGRSRIFVAHRP